MHSPQLHSVTLKKLPVEPLPECCQLFGQRRLCCPTCLHSIRRAAPRTPAGCTHLSAWIMGCGEPAGLPPRASASPRCARPAPIPARARPAPSAPSCARDLRVGAYGRAPFSSAGLQCACCCCCCQCRQRRRVQNAHAAHCHLGTRPPLLLLLAPFMMLQVCVMTPSTHACSEGHSHAVWPK